MIGVVEENRKLEEELAKVRIEYGIVLSRPTVASLTAIEHVNTLISKFGATSMVGATKVNVSLEPGTTVVFVKDNPAGPVKDPSDGKQRR
jgi:hypothetical protein